MECRAEKMTWTQLTGRARDGEIAIIPFGTTERHGNHLPMGTDAAIAAEVARWTAEKSGAVVFPIVPFGIIETTAFPGIFLSGHIYQELIREVTLSIESFGFYKILFLSGHHDNNPSILNVMKELAAEKPGKRVFCLVHCMTLIGEIIPEIIANRHIGHSDFRETSLMLAIDSSTVHMNDATQVEEINVPITNDLISIGIHKAKLESGSVYLCHQIEDITKNGGYGQLNGSCKETGENIILSLSDYLSKIIQEMKKM
jgi:creatinine amidohydrolase/Fe(II)-dependent formamide hydrolase-like protein